MSLSHGPKRVLSSWHGAWSCPLSFLPDEEEEEEEVRARLVVVDIVCVMPFSESELLK
jgi:hypothetical protein